MVEQYPISFLFVCGAVSFDLVEQYLLDLVEQYPKSISKKPRLQSGQTVGFSGNCTRVAQGAHKGRTGGAQGAHRGRAVHIFPSFFAFQDREMKFGEQNCMMISESFSFMDPGLRKLAKNELCDFCENSCTRVYGNWAKNELCHFLKIHVCLRKLGKNEVCDFF